MGKLQLLHHFFPNLLSACAKRKLIRRRRRDSESQLGEYSSQLGLEHWLKSFMLANATLHPLESGYAPGFDLGLEVKLDIDGFGLL